MLRDYYIIDRSGIGIYEYHIDDTVSIEFQLLAGLITALLDFSQTMLMDNVQVIKLSHAKLVFSASPMNNNLFGVGLYDIQDHDKAIKKANARLLKAFIEQIGETKPYGEYQQVQFNPKEALKYYNIIPLEIPSRKTYYIMISLTSLIIQTILFMLLTTRVKALLIHGIQSDLDYFLLYLGFGFPYLLTGVFLGDRKTATIAGMLLNTIISTAMLYQQIQLNLSQMNLPATDLSYGISLAFSFLGGYLAEFYFIKKR